MTGDQVAQLLAVFMMMALVGSSLIARRLPLAQTVRMALIWLLIFAAVLIGYYLLRGSAGWGQAFFDLT